MSPQEHLMHQAQDARELPEANNKIATTPDYHAYTYEFLSELGDEHNLGCKCCRFTYGKDLPVPKKLGTEETRSAARHFTISIFKDWTQLNAIIKRFEATIQKRWMKKSVKQRREILLKAWPGMSQTHRPDFENMRSIKKQAPRTRTCRTEAYLWPQINLEDLQSRNLLLHFLNSRGRNLPDTFRIADAKAAHLGDGWNRSLDYEQYFEDYCCEFHYYEDHDHEGEKLCLLFEEKCSPSRYGQVITNHIKELLPCQFKFLRRSNEGLLSLEIQQGIYRFLLSCAKHILHDVAPAQFFLAPSMPEPAVPETRSSEYHSFSAHSLEECYKVPQKLDLHRLRLLVDSRRASAEDHVWLLKEDPAYLMDVLREWKEHGVSHDDRLCNCKDCWNTCAGIALTYSLEVYVFWDDLYRKLKAMPEIDVQLARADNERVKLSRQDEDRWSALMDVVWHLVVQPISHLESGIPCSPRLRHRYSYSADQERKERWQLRASASGAERRIDQLWYSICREEQRDRHGLLGLIQEFQYMLDTDAEAAQYIDPWLTTHFSDIALCAELMHSVDALAPWLDENKTAMLRFRPSVAKQVQKSSTLQSKLRLGIHRVASGDYLVWDPTKKGWFEYPIDKTSSQANNYQMRLAELRLDKFWKRLEGCLAEVEAISIDNMIKCRLSQPRTLFRTAPWVEPPVTIPTPPPSPNEKRRRSGPLCEIDSNIQHGSNVTLAKKDLIKAHPKDKKKTRGTPAAQDPRLPAQHLPVVPKMDRVAVPKRAYKTLSTLLPSPAEAQQPRPELAWEEILFAFNAIGLQPTKLYGSAWIFSPVPKGEIRGIDRDGVITVGKMDLGRSIQFHEPKEVRRGQKVPRGMVRTFGRRLKHAFGWEHAEQLFESE
ncbi:uncharacterized protein MYCFIDRAFT_86406 [Pseudocercospora fijiensis CIRAD86]|uniref:Uncharacterized protein n=1 Tax=Pseudocercospora fijiensis (strain CIRAD86) TaxID=383855 RepID=N1Q9G6_PSEFD|nr:uncharacterized protein MYCFIDRAFT_86406 [Pseudocercospora fijiensis CIRAD86]EME89540.1 hypothetical protein MYCFIDRAFT_86406 [Pseudocercospora fijiensis CIRAD86]